MSNTRSKPTVARYRGAKSKSVRMVILLMSDGFATGPPQGGRPCEAGPSGPAERRSRKSRQHVKSRSQKNAVACPHEGNGSPGLATPRVLNGNQCTPDRRFSPDAELGAMHEQE